MRIVDIHTVEMPKEEASSQTRAGFHLEVNKLNAEQAKHVPHYELEAGKAKESKGWLKGWRKLSLSFNIHFGPKRYRVRTWFVLHCLLLFILFQTLPLAYSAISLAQTGIQAAHSASIQNLFNASLALKDTNKQLSLLGKIPKSLVNSVAPVSLASAWAEFFLRVAGYYNPRLYMVVFQNNAELRATGGFMGSYALVSIDKGVLQLKKLEGIYNASGQQRIAIIPPLPIQKVSTTWMFHDANWFFDFPTSAKAISWFYQKTDNPSVDGVIAITPELLKRLLELSGPISLPEFQTTLTSDNFIDMLQQEVEVTYKQRGLRDPKEILAHAAPLLLKKMFDLPKETLLSTLLESLQHKEILLYFERAPEEAFMNYQHWGGAIDQSEGDYLAVVNSNVNGYKTDRVIKQLVVHTSQVGRDGNIVDTVSITRNHQGGHEKYGWYNKVNGDFLRVYVPKGSQLLEVSGNSPEPLISFIPRSIDHFMQYPLMEKISQISTIDRRSNTIISQETNKTVFGNWIYVSPQEQATITFRYRLPFSVEPSSISTMRIPLTVQKQPGISYEFSHTLAVPENWLLLWESSETHSSFILSSDTRYESVFSL